MKRHGKVLGPWAAANYRLTNKAVWNVVKWRMMRKVAWHRHASLIGDGMHRQVELMATDGMSRYVSASALLPELDED